MATTTVGSGSGASVLGRSGFRLVLTGHLPGGPLHAWTHRELNDPGAFLRDWNGLRFTRGDSTLIASRGLADTLPLRFRCPREITALNLAPR